MEQEKTNNQDIAIMSLKMSMLDDNISQSVLFEEMVK
jgi:hypothetical protein